MAPAVAIDLVLYMEAMEAAAAAAAEDVSEAKRLLAMGLMKGSAEDLVERLRGVSAPLEPDTFSALAFGVDDLGMKDGAAPVVLLAPRSGDAPLLAGILVISTRSTEGEPDLEEKS